MINKIHLENIASYTNGVEFQPKKINFIYGANGTGKSTLSRVLDGEISSSRCMVTWENNLKEDVVVYNRYFVEKNFQKDTTLKGIFTLGEESIEIQKEIDSLRQNVETKNEENNRLQNSLVKLEDDQKILRQEIEQKCWRVQKLYGTEFSEALVGTRNKLKTFCDKCIECSKSLNEKEILSIDDLKILYQAAFTKNASKGNIYSNLPVAQIRSLDTFELLGTIIAGKSDTQIGAFIEYLNSSDWVRKGVEYASVASGKCPYCQRELPQNIQSDIEGYFDKKFEENKIALENYRKSYCSMAVVIKKLLHDIEDNKYSYIDYTEFDIKKEILIAKLDKNMQAIDTKLKFLSEIIEIETIVGIADELVAQIDVFNEKISKNNELVDNQLLAKDECKNKLWNFLTFQCIEEIKQFNRKNTGIENGKTNILKMKKQKEDDIRVLKADIQSKETKLTSVRPTVDAINLLLKQFGFNGFLLEVNEEKMGTYKIVRPSGEDASKTLSEGEHNFISFLYFYHLCFGSQNRTGLESKKVLVIDDPISSMDSNVLFIVSTLVKTIIRYCKDCEKGIEQIIVLTHNVYFHKEITFWGNKETLPSTQTRYFILTKLRDQSAIQEYENNPIRTSYELLWKDVKNENIGSANILMNVMRRILEHYFMVVGGINYERCINQIDGSDKIICKALVSFINEGSHSVFEDLIFYPDEGDMESYKRVFKLVFEKLGHIDHYNMMMNKD